MTVIQTERLHKTFVTKRKRAGFGGSMKALIHPERQETTALREISFAMEAGEVLGFIGPNGAGKSTTIKILTGILHPTSGNARVLGRVPWEERRQLAYHIGTVFGQRPQLWYHLPAIDTLNLFGKIYEMEDRVVRQRVGHLAEMFQIEDLLETPVRKLSLGQRMRCEVAASLIHQPKLVMLDEPSMGLDVVAKQNIRDTIRQMSLEEGVGVLLTSHDAGDIEALCDRVIVINRGQMVFDDSVTTLKRRYLTSKQVQVRYDGEIDAAFHIEGCETIAVDRYGASLRFDIRKTPVGAVMGALGDAGNLLDVTISDPSLEEVIRAMYAQVDARPHSGDD